eukprot:gnl/Dysnectes_brevis/1777_a2035_1598.p1 GENE.gnl/Dysnectes_brevis/1777_a2035_1598~~gnl/Dysnectes_brevis/1777_a2035_1598.p1  ORF type:complete len:505 (+),score=211.15 gnl/Dysnectes_brevis/1777_a2035_1598:58-1572(+)
MFTLLLVLAACSVAFSAVNVVPYPSQCLEFDTLYYIGDLSLSCTPASTQVEDAFQRLIDNVWVVGEPDDVPNDIHDVIVVIDEVIDTLTVDVDVSYTLDLTSSAVTITAPNQYGAMHGLSTLRQLITPSPYDHLYTIQKVAITDSPRFKWRGILIDTARHFLDADTIKRQIDGLSLAKMNVLHLHLTDAQAFALNASTVSDIANAGAWARGYAHDDTTLEDLAQYGLARGVIVVPETDIPGHAASWASRGVVANCPSYEHNINNLALDPTKQATYDAIADVFAGLSPHFAPYFHLGGDEVVLGCWNEDPDIASYMASKGIDANELWREFQGRVNDILPAGISPVVWQEAWENGNPLPSDAIVQAWEDSDTLGAAVANGYHALLSAGWYLDQQRPTGDLHYAFAETWKDFYGVDPLEGVPASKASLVLGGEACMWGEYVTGESVDGWIWPRTLAIAERLWSPASYADIDEAIDRLNNGRCMLNKAGIGAGPLTPSAPCPGHYFYW